MSVQRKKLYVTPIAQALALLLLTSTSAQAQDVPTASAGQLKEVVVSGSRYEQPVEELPASLDVLGRQALEDGQIQDIRDLAKDLPNVSVKRAPARFTVTGRGNPTGADANAGFSIRGLGGNRVLMLVDGVRLPRSYINGNNAFGRDAVDLGLLQRVEIIHGPSSALYGSDGLAGLVNFITLTPADILRDSNGVLRDSGGKAWVSYSGDDNGATLGGTVAHRAGDNAEWLLSSSVGRADGLKNMGDNDAANVSRTTPNPQTSNNASLLGKLVWRPTGSQSHTFTLEQVQKDIDVTLLSSAATPLKPLSSTNKTVSEAVLGENASYDLNRTRLAWEADYVVNAGIADKVKTLVSWQNSRAQEDGQTRLAIQSAKDGLRLRQTSYKEHGWQATVQAEKTWRVSSDWGHKLTYGVDWSQTDVSSFADGSDPLPIAAYVPKKYFPDTRDTAQALYVHSEWLNERWSLTPGVRFDQFSLDVLSQEGYYPPAAAPGKSLSGSAVSPKLGVMFKATPQWSLYGNYASGFRAPEGQQLNSVVEINSTTPPAELLPNPNLKPEVSHNLEFGIKAQLDRLSFNVAAFSSRFTDLIQEKNRLGVYNGKTQFQTVNINKASISGYEIRGRYDWGRFASGQLSTPFSYGSTRGTNDVTGLPLNSIDPATLSLGLSYHQTDWFAQLNLNHSEGKSLEDLDSPYIPSNAVTNPNYPQFLIPAATTLDLHTQWRPRKGLRLNLAVINLTDRKYWNWSDVQGVSTAATTLVPAVVVDAYTQPGRHVNVSMVVDF